MRRRALLAVAVLASLSLLAACAAYRYQHGPRTEESAAEAAAQPPSNAFRQLGTSSQLAEVRGEAAAIKADLARQGKYACCVHPSCSECLMQRGECYCRRDVEANGPCCGECTEAWLDGRGTLQGLSALELLERRKRLVEEQGEQHQHHR